jgi:hypothetical protein
MMQKYTILHFTKPTEIYMASEVEPELARLRERVAELDERDSLLLEAVRWLLDNGVGSCGENLYQHFGNSEPIEPPAHLAPLIAEAVKGDEHG